MDKELWGKHDLIFNKGSLNLILRQCLFTQPTLYEIVQSPILLMGKWYPYLWGKQIPQNNNKNSLHYIIKENTVQEVNEISSILD